MKEEAYKKRRGQMDGVEEPPARAADDTAAEPPAGGNFPLPAKAGDLPANLDAVPVHTDNTGNAGRQKIARQDEERKGGKPVLIYILLLFTAALLLMVFSSLVHQRSTLGELGQIRHDLSAMQDVQNFQEKIISLQEARQELEEQLKTMQSDMNGLIVQAREERGRTEAMRYLYRIQMQYWAGRYQACQMLIEEFEAAGLVKNLPAESEDSAVPSPLERYQEIKAANAVQVTEALAPRTGVVVEEWTPAEGGFIPEGTSLPEGETAAREGAQPGAAAEAGIAAAEIPQTR